MAPTPWHALADLAYRITATSGDTVRATPDPTRAHAPVVLVAAVGVDPDGVTGDGHMIVNVECSIRPGGWGPEALAWAWDVALPAVMVEAGIDDARLEVSPDDGLPALLVRTQVKTEPPPPPLDTI